MNETILYICLGIIWLIYRAISKRKNPKQSTPNVPQTGKSQRQPVSFEDLLKELAPPPPQQTFAPVDPDPVFSAPPLPRQPLGQRNTVQPPPLKEAMQKPEAVAGPALKRSLLLDELRNPKSAQTAIVLGEILGKPHALRSNWRVPKLPQA